jgi:hypothetical protein
MSDQQVPGFYAVGDEDTFLVSPDGQVFEVVRGGMEGPVLTRVDALPPAVPLRVMDGALILPSLLLQAARLLDATSSSARPLRRGARCPRRGPVGRPRRRRRGPRGRAATRRAARRRGRPRTALAQLPAPTERALHGDLRAPLRRFGGHGGGLVTAAPMPRGPSIPTRRGACRRAFAWPSSSGTRCL